MKRETKGTIVRVAAVLLPLMVLMVVLVGLAQQTAAAPNDHYVFIPIGDSNIVGYGVKDQLTCDNEPRWGHYASYRYWLYDILKKNGVDFEFAGSIDLVPQPANPPGTADFAYCPDDYKDKWTHVADSSQVKFIGWNSRTADHIAGVPDPTDPNKLTCFKPFAQIPGTAGDSNWCLPKGLDNLNPTPMRSDHVVALVHLGTNDVIDGRDWNESRDALKSILQQLKDYAKPYDARTVMLAMIMPSATNVDTFNRDLANLCLGNLTDAEFNELYKGTGVADFDGVLNKPCVNYGTGSNQIGFPKPADFDIYLVNMNYDFTPYLDSQHPSDFQSDNIHTNLAGEAKMAKRWYDTAVEIGTPVEGPCEQAAGNEVSNNCGFTQGRRFWHFRGRGDAQFGISSVNYHTGPRAAEITILNDKTKVQLYRKNIFLWPNTQYELFFTAYSSDGSDMKVFFHKHTPPYTSYGLKGETVDLETSWKEYSICFTTPDRADIGNGRLRFWFGADANAGTVYHIDQVAILPDSEVCP